MCHQFESSSCSYNFKHHRGCSLTITSTHSSIAVMVTSHHSLYSNFVFLVSAEGYGSPTLPLPCEHAPSWTGNTGLVITAIVTRIRHD